VAVTLDGQAPPASWDGDPERAKEEAWDRLREILDGCPGDPIASAWVVCDEPPCLVVVDTGTRLPSDACVYARAHAWPTAEASGRVVVPAVPFPDWQDDDQVRRWFARRHLWGEAEPPPDAWRASAAAQIGRAHV
jgi:hypothetical protein